MFGVWLAIDQYQVRTDMTVPMVLPLAAKCVVVVARCKQSIFRQIGHNTGKFDVNGLGEAAFPFASVIPFESRSPPNRPH